MKTSFFQRPLPLFFCCCSITLLCMFIARDIRFGKSLNSIEIVYTIQFEYFGMDAQQIEKLITVPLEERLQELTNVVTLRSVSEYGKSTTTLYFEKNTNKNYTYTVLSDIVDTLYARLPQTVQKPRIYSSDLNQSTFMSIAFINNSNSNAVRSYIETQFKPQFESIDGVAQVMVVGGTIEEVQVQLDSQRILNAHLDSSSFAKIIQDSTAIYSAAILREPKEQTTVRFETAVDTLEEMKNIPVQLDNTVVNLSNLALIGIGSRQKEEIVRVDGDNAVALLIKASYDANSIRLSKDCRSVLNQSGLDKNSYIIVHDSASFLLKLTKNVIIGLCISFMCVICIVPIFFASMHTILLIIIFLPITCIWTIAQLHLLGFSLDQNTLAGITLSFGLIADPLLLIASVAQTTTSTDIFYAKIKKLQPAIITSSCTTLLTLIPLYFFEKIIPGIRPVVCTIALMITNSLILSSLFFTGFIIKKDTFKPPVSRQALICVEKQCLRIAMYFCAYSLLFKKLLRFLIVFLILATLIIFFSLGKDLSVNNTENTLFITIEFENEQNAKSIDTLLESFISSLKEEDSVSYIQSESRRGRASLYVGFDDKRITRYELAKKIITLAPLIPSGFLYIPDLGKTKKEIYTIEVVIRGDENEICRNLASSAVQRLLKDKDIVQSVLHFKRADKIVSFVPNRDLLARNNLSVKKIASDLRLFVFGPVIDKWLHNNSETDIRIFSENTKTRTLLDLNKLVVRGENNTYVTTLGNFIETTGNANIYRHNGRRAAFFSVHINATSTSQALNKLSSILNTLPLNKGYVYEYAHEIVQMQSTYQLLSFAFFLSILGVWLLLTIFTEDLLNSLCIILMIPLSLFLPLLTTLLFGLNLHTGSVIGMVLVSGVTVNNAIYIFESKKQAIILKVREKTRNIFAISLTSIISALPLVLLARDDFSFSLSFFVMWGMVGSLFSTLILYPAILVKKQTSKGVSDE